MSLFSLSLDAYTTHFISAVGNNRLQAAGCNYYGQLGNGTNDNSFDELTEMQLPQSCEIKDVFASFESTYILLESGDVLACGKNRYGQLGLGWGNKNSKLKKIPQLDHIKQFACGFSHALALSTDGQVYASGAEQGFKSGYFEYQHGIYDIASFTAIKFDDNLSIRNIFAGGLQNFAIDSAGRLLAWGDNLHGQLGLGLTHLYKKAVSPLVVSLPEECQVKTVHTTQGFSLILCENGQVFSCGDNSNGQLGRYANDIADKTSFQLIQTLPKIVSLKVGRFHALALDENGQVWAWGCNNEKQIINESDKKNIIKPICITRLPDKVIAIHCGAEESYLLTENNCLTFLGSNPTFRTYMHDALIAHHESSKSKVTYPSENKSHYNRFFSKSVDQAEADTESVKRLSLEQ